MYFCMVFGLTNGREKRFNRSSSNELQGSEEEGVSKLMRKLWELEKSCIALICSKGGGWISGHMVIRLHQQ